MKMLKSWVVMPVLLLLGACATVPTGPSLMALPGTGKDFNEFRASDFECRRYASQVIGGLADDPGVRHAVVGTTVGAVAGAAIGGQQGAAVGAGVGLLAGSASGAESSRSYGYGAQRRYDESYIQCMYASGHKVPVPASMARSLMQVPASLVPGAAPGAVPGKNIPPPPPNMSPPSSPPPDYVPPPAR
ncbi:MAG: YMGG-like glycine zipper-containing protein [Betaproteobacteria bacterium]